MFKEMVYIQKGSGILTLNGKEYPMEEDVVMIEAKEKFCWEGTMTLFIACHPA